MICTNTGVVGESTEITITFNTLCFFAIIVIVDASTQSLSRIIMLLLFAKFALETDLSGDLTF